MSNSATTRTAAASLVIRLKHAAPYAAFGVFFSGCAIFAPPAVIPAWLGLMFAVLALCMPLEPTT